MKQSVSRTQQRRERERQELRQAILNAACEIAAQEGWQAVTIRKVAEQIEYSPGSIYSYFESKEAILQTLVKDGYARMGVELRAALSTTTDTETQILTLAGAYWDFAWRYPELYQVMHSLSGAPFSCANDPLETREAFHLSHELLNRWMLEQSLDTSNSIARVEAIWGLLHGLLSLTLMQRLRGNREEMKQVVLQTLRDLLWSWQHQR